MFKPKAIYFENKILEYPLGKKLIFLLMIS